MMKRIYIILVGLILSAVNLKAQQRTNYTFTLDDVIQLAKEQSPQAIQARHSFRASYFSFMDYRAEFLPKLALTTNPTTWDKSIRTIEQERGGGLVITEVRANTLTSTAGLALTQNIGFTGGNISLGSDFRRSQNFEASGNPATFTTTPVRLSLSQPLNGYNQFRWLREIEPLRYEEAKQNYIVSIENVASRAVSMFFALAIAQVNLNMLETNFENQKALLEISRGRFELGRIAEDGLLSIQLRYMQAESRLNSARIDLRSRESQLRSFLGFTENVDIELLIDTNVPSFVVDFDEAMNLALTSNPDVISWQRRILEARRTVAQARSQTGITMSLDASFGINQTGNTFIDAYSPRYDDRQGVGLRINVPLLDWSQTRNRYRSAQSSLEVLEAQIQQQETDFNQDIYLQVMSFNMQENQLRIAATADTIAQKSYEISYARYMMGIGNILELNDADNSKDNARITFMRELQTFWNYYYALRRLTLFDFLNNRPLEEDFDAIIGL